MGFIVESNELHIGEWNTRLIFRIACDCLNQTASASASIKHKNVWGWCLRDHLDERFWVVASVIACACPNVVVFGQIGRIIASTFPYGGAHLCGIEQRCKDCLRSVVEKTEKDRTANGTSNSQFIALSVISDEYAVVTGCICRFHHIRVMNHIWW